MSRLAAGVERLDVTLSSVAQYRPVGSDQRTVETSGGRDNEAVTRVAMDVAGQHPGIQRDRRAYVNDGDGGAGLTPPWEEGGRGKYADQPILILGGSTAIGQPG